MSALTFRLRESPPERLDLSRLVPSRLAGLSAADMERLPVGTTRLGLVAGDIFAVAPGDAAEIRIVGGSSRLDRVGEGMSAGRILVEGDVGQRLGFAMAGGDIHVAGSAGPFTASGARAGTIHIDGDAGAQAGGAVHGAMRGLNGGTLVIGGRAGPRLGDRMAAGLILVGQAGEFTGCRMIAGTIVSGTVGDHAGYAMRRGTLVVQDHGRLAPGFVDTGRHRLVILRLLRQALAPFPARWRGLVPGDARRFSGDMATLGKGEILVAGVR